MELTRRELQSLHLLARNDDRSVDVFVRRLRHKLERSSPAWRYIHTHFGVGYRFGAEAVGVDAVRAEAEPADEAGDSDDELSRVLSGAARPRVSA